MIRSQKLKTLERTRDFYNVELEKDLTEKEINKYLRALKLVEGFIEREKKPGEEKSKNPFLNPDGSFDLIEKFPVYRKKRLKKAGKQIKGGHE